MSLIKKIFCLLKTALHHLLPLVVLAYILAATFPSIGIWVKHCVVVQTEQFTLALPMILLAILLFNASVGSSAGELGSVFRRPHIVLVGVLVNLLIPIAFLAILKMVLQSWHDHEEANCLMFGLAVVAAMPVAGSSTAWSQNANGNIALSLGLVLFSTLLSPLTTPLVLNCFGGFLNGDTNHSVHGTGGQDTSYFLLAYVVLPSALGLLFRCLMGGQFIAFIKPALKLVNAMILIFLCYSNASVALPQVVADPDWDFLALVLAAVSGLCFTAFLSGWLLAKILRVNYEDRSSLIFGLGMNNNGTGLVLAASSLSSLPWAVVPVLIYNLIQHLFAGSISRTLSIKEINNKYLESELKL